MRRLALAPILVCALLSPSTALALGVGDIQLQSALNQPLDAEIPLRGVSSEERGDIVVTLASEQAFREVGLERPFSLNRLEFEVASRNGSHYIQISSNEPITEPFLSFLIEVDSPQGNLLREYTVLLDPPVFASEDGGETDSGGGDRQAARQTEERSDAGAARGDMSGRVTETDATADAEPADDMSASAPSASPQRDSELDDTPMFLRIAREEEAAERRTAEQAAQRERERQAAAAQRERAQPQPATATRSTRGGMAASSGPEEAPSQDEAESPPQEYGPVREGETLWNIAERLKRGEVTTQQMMLALLRYNPEAFETSNVNRLKQGYVLRVPDRDEVRSISAQQAIARIREQNGLWREWRDSLQQRGATRVAAAQEPQSPDEPVDTTESGGDDGAAPTADGSDSRLDIVGADEGGATSDESASATASGSSEAREQLQLAREELASVRSEKQDLAERVEQLESTVSKMEQLVTVREQQLAQLERQLAELREQTDESGDTATAASAAGDATEDEQSDSVADSGDAPQDDSGDAMVADASGSDTGGGDGGPAASGGSDGAGGSGTAGDSAATDGAGSEPGATAEGGGDTSASGDDSGTQTAASDQQREVVNPADDAAPQQERGWLDAALGFLGGIGTAISGAVGGGGALSLPVIGGAGVAVLALTLLAVRRRRSAQAAADEEFMGPVTVGERHAETEPMGLSGDDGAAAEAPETTSDKTAQDTARSSLMDEELDLSGLDVDPEAATPGDEAEQDDTLVEADTYLAYGLHQQAEDLLRLAIEEHPQRLDYREKLLEALSAAGKSDEFVSAAEDLHNRLDDPSSPAWQRVSAMGRKIAPDSALFAAGAATAGGAAMAASGDDTLDEDFAFDLDSEPAAPGGDLPEDDLDFGEAAAAEAPTEGGSGAGELSFDLSDLESPTPATEPAPDSGDGAATMSSGGDDGGLDFDLSDFETNDGTQSPASEGAASDTRASSASTDDGLDFDLGDLGIDDSSNTIASSEGTADSGDSSVQDDGEIDLSDFGGLDLDDDSGDSTAAAAPAESGEGEIDLSFDQDESSNSGSSDLADFDLGDSGPGETSAAASEGPTTSNEDDPFAGLDDFGLSDSDTSASTPIGDQSSASTSDREDPFAGLEDLGGGDADSGGEFDLGSFEQGFGEPDSAPAGAPADAGGVSSGADDDLATMLDLAKAYIDMGDAESASNALEEVIAGGTEQQRAEARSLLESVQ